MEHVDHVDLDGEVIEVCKEHFRWGAAWDDPRVKLHIDDGASFIRNAPTGFYDVIIQDSSDPWTWNENGDIISLPSEVLYSEEHFRQIFRALGKDGILNLQAESVSIPTDLEGIVHWRRQALKVGFDRVRYGSVWTSSYPTGQIGFLLCEKDSSSASTMKEIEKRFERLQKQTSGTRYFHPKLQTSSFDLPLWVERKVYVNETIPVETKDEL